MSDGVQVASVRCRLPSKLALASRRTPSMPRPIYAGIRTPYGADSRDGTVETIPLQTLHNLSQMARFCKPYRV